MTGLEKLCAANRWRIRAADPTKPSSIASSDFDGWNGHFMVPLEGEIWHVTLSDRRGWKHLWVANAGKRIAPSWSVMCQLKSLFYADDEWVVQFFPPKDYEIYDASFRLHLWTPLNETLPHPTDEGTRADKPD
jgi:hypothetical protein